MATIKKNWESDLRIAVTLKLDGVAVPVPNHDFVLRWCVCGGTKYYDCSFIGGAWKDCKPSDDGSKVLCFLNSPRLGIGELHCKYYDYAPDDDFSDKNMLTVTPSNVDIELVSGAGDDAYEIDVDLAIEISQAIADAQAAAANANEAAEYARETVERLADFDPKANTDLVVNITKNGNVWVADASFDDAYEYLINPATGRVILHVQFTTRYGDREEVYAVASVLDEEANGRGQGIIIAGGVIVGDNSVSVEWSENAGFIGVVFSELALDEDTVPSDVSWLDTQQVATASQDQLLFTLLNKHRPMRINNALVVETSKATAYPRTVSVVSNNTLTTYHLNADRTITKSSKELANAADVEKAKSLSEALASEIGFVNYGTIEIASSGANVAGRSVTIRFASYNELWYKNGATRVVLPINAGTKYTLSQRDNLYYSIENNAIVQTSDVLFGQYILLASCDRGLIVGGRILEVTEHLSRINSIDPTRVAIVYDAEWVKHEAQQTQENYNALWAAIQGNDIVTLDGEVVVGAFAGNAGISFTSILRYSDLNDAAPHGIGCTTYSIVSTNGVVQIDAKTSSISLDGPFVFIVRERRVGQATRLESTISISEILEKANMGKTVMMLLPNGHRAPLVKVGDNGSLTFVAVIDSVEHTYTMPNNGDTSTIVVHTQKELAGGLLVVTVTGSDQEALTADHTAAEILAAHDAGRPVVAVYGGEVYQLASVGASLASFSLASADLEVLAQIDVDGDGGAVRIFDEVQGALTAGDGIVIDGTKISAEREIFWIDIKEQGSGYVYADGFDPASIKAAYDASKMLVVRCLHAIIGSVKLYSYYFVFSYAGASWLAIKPKNSWTALTGFEILGISTYEISVYKCSLSQTPTSGSNDLITSGGVFTALQGKADTTALQNFCPLIEDTRASAVSEITGVAPFATLQDGQRVLLKLNYNSSYDSTLNLTLSDGTTTGAIPIYVMTYLVANKRLSASDARAGGYIELIYNESDNHWQMVGYKDMNTTYNTTNSTAIKQGTLTGGYLVSPAVLRECFYIKDEAQAKRRVVDASGADFVELQADAYEKLGTTDAPVVSLPASYTAADEFLYSFTCATDACVVTLPQGVVLADCCDDFSEVAAGVWFQVSIMDGVAAYLCVTPQN